MEIEKKQWWGLLLILIGLGIPFFFIRNSLYFPMGLGEILIILGKMAGFSAFLLFTLQYLLTARFHNLERFIPYDQRVAIHRTIGFSGFLVLVLHPILIMTAYNLNGRSLYFSSSIVIGFTALLICLIVVGSTFLGRMWRVKFETWKKIHYVTFIILTAAFIHSIGIGSDIFGINRIIWILLWAMHIAVIIGKIISKMATWSRLLRVTKVIQVNPGTTTLIMEKPKQSWIPGQFGFMNLKKGNRWEGWHPFSITSNPDDDYIAMTIKSLGDFTETVGETKQGDLVKLNPGFGGFIFSRHSDARYTMIAGGVGITPIYSLIKSLYRQDDPSPVRLLYTVHHESEILFREELELWFNSNDSWDLSIIVTSQPEWKGATGRLTPEKCLNLCKNDLSGTFFLCGPARMTNSLGNFLKEQGVSKSKIVSEYFQFLI